MARPRRFAQAIPTIILATWLGAPAAQAKVCTPAQAEAADALIDRLGDWASVDEALRKFGNCDDGAIAERR